MSTTTTRRRGRPRKNAPAAKPEIPVLDPLAEQHKPLPPKLEELSTAVAVKLLDGLKTLLPIIARLAAADTLHTTERPETVLDRAIKEGKLAASILKDSEVRNG